MPDVSEYSMTSSKRLRNNQVNSKVIDEAELEPLAPEMDDDN